MSKIFFNTKTFDDQLKNTPLNTTINANEATLLVLGAQKVDFKQFPNIKAVYRFGVGIENIDFDYLKSQGIAVHFPSNNTKDILYSATADFTVYGILKIIFDSALGDVEKWQKGERSFIGHKTALVIGTGNIGARVATRLKAFMKVLTYDVTTNPVSDLALFLKQADVITTHTPLVKETKNFFDREKLALIKDDALLVNTARGELFDEAALYDKLTHSQCRAFFDVFWQEPYHGKLKSLGEKKFFMTPHTASNTAEFVTAGFADIVKLSQEF